MAYRFTFTNRFQKHYKSLTEQEKAQLMKKLNLLVENPAHPSLRTKRIQGTDKLYESSVNLDVRIIWYYEEAALIVLADVGHHDILK
jgi:mRNA-degrading endonuclease RelE of RelBE toxin-antitoxin system